MKPSSPPAPEQPDEIPASVLLDSFDWSSTPLGPRQGWPASLQTLAKLVVASRFPKLIVWGPEFVQIYNDAYRPVLGTKHPNAFGQRARDCWPELWPTIGPMFEHVLSTGEAIAGEDVEFLFKRFGYLEETYFNFSYSPVADETGGPGGVLVTCFETTRTVISERRMRVLSELSAEASRVKTLTEACAAVARVCDAHPRPLPFALVYLLGPDERTANLVVCSGLPRGGSAAPAEIDLRDPALCRWPVADVLRSRRAVEVGDFATRFGSLTTASGAQPRLALILPITAPGSPGPVGLLVAGANPRRALDDHYRNFFELLAAQVGTTISSGRAHELEQKRTEELAALDRAKTAFFSNVSHEFRTPLTLMLGPLEHVLVNLRSTLPAPVRSSLEVSHRNGLRLLKLVNSLLEFSRIEAGRVQATFQPTDLASFTRDIASVFRSAVEAAGLRFSVEAPSLSERVYVDREMWEKIVLNLLSNAFKFTLAGEISVSLTPAAGAINLVVADTGVGIAEADLPRIFERFRTVKNARGRSYEGTGIGLALVQEMVRLHGGTINVESALGAGSRFTVTLPLGHAHLPPDQVQHSARDTGTPAHATSFLAEALRWTDGPTNDTVIDDAVDDAPPRLAEEPDAKATILVADDNADVRDYLAHLLSRRHRVLTAADGAQALELIATTPPDLVVADVMMPRCDGFALLQQLRANPNTRTLPVILISGRAGEESRLDGLAAGADDYLVKPFGGRDLIARVESQLKLSHMRRAAELRERELRELAEARQKRMHFLAELSPVLLRASLDLKQSLTKVIQLSVPRIADWCYIDLLDEHGRRDRVAVFHREPEKVQAAQELFRRFAPRPDDSVGSAEVLQTGRSRLYPELDGETLRRVAQSEEHLALLRQFGLVSAIFVPLQARDRCLGVLALATAESGRRYGPEDLEMAEEIATRAGLAIENARLYAAAQELNAELEARVQERTRDLQRMQQQYQLLFEASPLPMFVLDRETKRFLAVNEAAVRMYGYTRDEMLGGLGVPDVRPPEGMSFFIAAVPREPTAGNRLAVWRHRRKDGTPVELELAIGQVTWNGNPALLVLANDVTERRRAQESLREANATLQAIFNAAPVAIVATDLEGRVLSWNPGAERMFGWSAAEVIGSTPPVVPEESRSDFKNNLRRVLQAKGDAPLNFVRWRQRKNGERILANMSAALLHDASRKPIGILTIIEDVTERERAREAIQSYSERLERLSRQLLEAQELERRNIARELHDEIGQSLTLLKMQLENAQRAWPGDAAEPLAKVHAGMARLLTKVRQLCLELRPALLDDLGLLPALLAHIDRLHEQEGIRCAFHHEGLAERRFAPVVETTAYRIVQEALTNVIRHAGVQQARVTVWADDDVLQVTVEDRGRGFDLEQALRSGRSSGLAGMHERAKLAGGELKVVTAAGEGTGVTLELPLTSGSDSIEAKHV